MKFLYHRLNSASLKTHFTEIPSHNTPTIHNCNHCNHPIRQTVAMCMHNRMKTRIIRVLKKTAFKRFGTRWICHTLIHGSQSLSSIQLMGKGEQKANYCSDLLDSNLYSNGETNVRIQSEFRTTNQELFTFSLLHVSFNCKIREKKNPFETVSAKVGLEVTL
jgi:hypothetical protein